MTDVFLHLGAHKTGTTYLQAWMRGSAAFFDAHDSRWESAEDARADIRAWHRDLRRDNAPTSLVELMHAVADDSRRSCLVSWEGMLGTMDLSVSKTIYPDARVVLEVLRESLGSSAVKVGFAVRNYADFVESGYKWMVRHHYSYEFADYLASIEVDGLSWIPSVTAIREIFGSENTYLWSQEEFDRDPGEGTARVLRFFYGPECDLSTLGEPPAGRRNVSPNAKALEFARGVHQLLEESELFTRADRARLNPLIRTFVNKNFPRKFDAEPPVLMDPDTRSELTSRYEQDCRVLGIPL